jgi:hypothetical protein
MAFGPHAALSRVIRSVSFNQSVIRSTSHSFDFVSSLINPVRIRPEVAVRIPNAKEQSHERRCGYVP